ncbi:hypothetical protein GCM10027048_20190 [Hymenobacter coalescens]
MKNTPTFAIPVPGHVKQFLLSEFGPEPLNIHQNTFMGRVTLMKVEKVPFRQLEKESKPDPKKNLLIALPTALKHYRITPDGGREIGEMLQKFFQQQMILFVKGQVAATGNERAALRSFFNLYGLDPDAYDLEVARKVYRDYKDRVLKANGHLAMMDTPGLLHDDQAAASHAVAS